MSKLDQITGSEVYTQVLSDSFGGIMYNVANYGKYDSSEILAVWGDMTAAERECANGITKGVINFLKGDK